MHPPLGDCRVAIEEHDVNAVGPAAFFRLQIEVHMFCPPFFFVC